MTIDKPATDTTPELWVARDTDGSLSLYAGEPEWLGWRKGWSACCGVAFICTLYRASFPDLQPGEKRRLVMETRE